MNSGQLAILEKKWVDCEHLFEVSFFMFSWTRRNVGQKEMLNFFKKYCSVLTVSVQVLIKKLHNTPWLTWIRISFTSYFFWKKMAKSKLSIHKLLQPSHFKKQNSSSLFLLPQGNNTSPNSAGVLSKLFSCLKCMKLTCWVLQAILDLYYILT